MSVRQTELVWELELATNRKLVLLELADHADPDGRHVFPSQEFIARRTGYSTRQIRRILRELEFCPDPVDGRCSHGPPESPHLGLIAPVAHLKGGRGMATEYELHLDPESNRNAVKSSGYSDEKADICDINPPENPDIYDIKADIHDTSAEKKADIHDINPDICDQKADICDQKADTHVLPTVKNRHINERETSAEEVPTSSNGEYPDWFNVLSGLDGFGQSFEICQNWLMKNNVPEATALTQAYGLRDWLSRQKAGTKALRGDPWTRFTSWIIRDLNESRTNNQPDNSPDKYELAKQEAERRGQ